MKPLLNPERTALVIDRGNTLTKATLRKGGNIVSSGKFSDDDIREFFSFISSITFDAVILSDVRRNDEEFKLELKENLAGQSAGMSTYRGGTLLILDAYLPLPLEIVYETPSTLGADRIAAAAGALSLFPGTGVLVVDSGTAVTADIVDAAGRFLGGNISPGIKLRFNSLHLWARLPLIDREGDIPDFGVSTATAIRSGVIRGVAREIRAEFEDASSERLVKRVVVTGGDAPDILPLLQDQGIPARYEPELVEKGLLKILDYNLSLK